MFFSFYVISAKCNEPLSTKTTKTLLDNFWPWHFWPIFKTVLSPNQTFSFISNKVVYFKKHHHAWSCSKTVWHPRKCPKVTFVEIFIEYVDYTLIFYEHIHFLDWNSIKKEIFREEQVWRLNHDKSLRA